MIANKQLFTDKETQAFFDTNGYVKIKNCGLNQDEINELNNFLNESGIKEYTENAVYMAMDNTNKKALEKMNAKIKSIVLPKLETFIIDPLFFYGSFIIKYPNPKVTVLPHQDGTFVEDESKNYSVTCWIPLTDVDINNGCMGFVKGSNKIYASIRPLPSPQVVRPLSKHSFSLVPYFNLVEMKAGEILIFDNKTFHNSPPNLSTHPRVAISSWITQKEASLRFYYLKPGTKDTLLKYAIDENFYLKYDNTILSQMYNEGKVVEDYTILDEEKYIYDDISKKEMIKRVEKAGNVFNKDFEQHMYKYFSNEMKITLFDKIKQIF